MHVISRKKLLDAAAIHAELGGPLDIWYRITKRADWQNIIDARKQFPTADAVGKFTVFNIKGNNYRLIAEIFYPRAVVLVRAVLTHAEYNKGSWKL